ncbi:hypothetical protein NQZ68_006106 [Dissostichus eleginoides]|nr:hypothetical protein NQZ68_006106 [Dissostichus eleginoides]
MPVVIGSRISVNCHPVTGRLHVVRRRPLLPTDLRVCPGPDHSDEGTGSPANPEESPSVGHLSPHHRAQAPGLSRGESWTTHPEDSEAQDSQPILLTCHTAPALGKALPNCSAC